MPLPRVRTVFFDLGGTFLRVEPSVGEVYARTAGRHGCDVSPRTVEANFQSAWKRSVERARARDFRCSDAILQREWLEIVRDSLGAGVPAELLPAIFEELYAHFASGKAWTLAPGALESVAHLRRRGLQIGVLSNWDSRVSAMLDDLTLARTFDLFVISHEVGFEKPHERIFREALTRSRTLPSEALHIGDSLRADILPARLLGLGTLWIAPDSLRDQSPEAGPGAASLAEVSSGTWDALLEAAAR
jgi:putative hydrolase of the HAD superfamily